MHDPEFKAGAVRMHRTLTSSWGVMCWP